MTPYLRDCLQTAEVHLSAEQQGTAAALILQMGCADGGGRQCLWAFARALSDEDCLALCRALQGMKEEVSC